MKRLVIMPALLMGTRPFDAISLAQPRHIQPILPVTKEIEMHQKDTGRLTRMLRASGTFFAPLVVASVLLLTACDGSASDKTRARGDMQRDSFVTKNFEKLKGSDFKLLEEKKTADGWQFIYESDPTPELPKFRVVVTIGDDGRDSTKVFKQHASRALNKHDAPINS